MEKEMMGLENVEYNELYNLFEDDIRVCELLEEESSYFLDEIVEISYRESDVSNAELFRVGYELYMNDFIKESLFNYGSKEVSDDSDFMNILSDALSSYYQRLLYDNLENVIRNIAINYINDNDLPVTEEELDDMDLDTNIDSFREVTEKVDEYMSDKANDIISDFDQDEFISKTIDILNSEITEQDDFITYDVDTQLMENVLNDNNLQYEDLETYQLEDEFDALCIEVKEKIVEQMNQGEYYTIEIEDDVRVYNTPRRLVKKVKSLIGEEFTVEDMDVFVTGYLKAEYETEYYDSIYEGDSEMYIYDAKSYGYNLGQETWLNVSWEVVQTNEDMYSTIIKVTEVELI